MKILHGDPPSTNQPLLFFQVLEDEYTALYGPLPDAYLKSKQVIQAQETTEHEMNEKLVAGLYTCLRQQQRAALCLSGGGIRSDLWARGFAGAGTP